VSNFEPEHPFIDIAFVSTDVVTAWKRPIRLRFKGNNEVQVTLYWTEENGYSCVIEKYFDEWSDDAKEDFRQWLQEQTNLQVIHELTYFPAFDYKEDEDES
jgi:hypothetical protein